MTPVEGPHGETTDVQEAGPSVLLPSVVTALGEVGLTEADYARQFWADGVWYGDACGCSDDRCAGFHHDAAGDCGCFPVLLDQAVAGLVRAGNDGGRRAGGGRTVSRARTSYGEAYWRGYERGVQAGHAAGYREGVSVLDDAAEALAASRPSRTVAMLAARQRMAEATGPGLTPWEIRARAAESWGLPVPADLTGPTIALTEPAAGAAPAGAELADDDDWAWQV